MKTIFKYLFLLIPAFVIMSETICAQEEHKLLREGNKNYEKGKYSDAELNYQKMLQKKADSYKGNFNLGDAYYKQGKFQDAANQFEMLTAKKTSKDTLAKAYHNLGNSHLKNYLSQPKMIANDSLNQEKEKILTNAVEAYKKALKNNSKDEDTRYNLAYANRLLKQQQQQNKQNKKDKDKDKKDKKDKDKKDQDKKDQKQDNKQDQQQPQLSKEDAKRLLDASNNEEKNTQDKLKKEKAMGKKGQVDKDW